MTAISAAPAAPIAPWFETWFDTPYYHQLYGSHDESEAAGFVDALVARLQPGEAATMLDLGCGAGRHSRSLAAHGFDVTGLDLAGASIRAASAHETPALRFRRHDMRVPYGEQQYDYVFNFFTSFGYFASAAEHDAVVRNLALALKAQGTLVIDYLNIAPAERNVRRSEHRVVDGVHYRLKRWSSETHFFKRIKVEDLTRGGHVEHFERVAKFRLEDFERMLSRHGLRIEAAFGDYQLGPYDAENSPRLIMVARRDAAEMVAQREQAA